MLQAKHSGKGCYRLFDPAGNEQLQVQHQAIRRMRAALQDREFLLYYQPKVDLSSGKVYGAEALIRWRHPERGILPPGAFLPAIESDELMVELGEWVIGEALAQMQRWQHLGLELEVSVNIAAQQLVRPNFMESLRAKLVAYPELRGRLEIEVLETTALEDINHVAQLIEACRELGVGFALDDFGTGYSSLTYLRRLPADTLKIDQSFIRTMMVDTGDRAIVEGVIALARAFRRNVIAEGVETVAHGTMLVEMGCNLVQGYAIARPMPAEDLPAWLGAWPTPAWLEVIASCRG
jgi:EAL domain-containing protein (putative c-di-GMP-specific phosphodiesterase class I)